MLLFNRIRNGRRRNSRGETGTQATAMPGANNGGRGGRNNTPSDPRRPGAILSRVHVPVPWRWKREKRRSIASGIRIEGPADPVPSAQEMEDPMVSFSPVTDSALDGAILHDEVPDIIGNKIQKHHELWYHLAYGRPRDRRVSGGYALQPARLAGQPLPRPNVKHSKASGLTHIASWRTRPRPWSETGSPDDHAAGGHKPITSIDYGNADEVVLSNTQEADGDILQAEDTLPVGSPKFMLHPYDKRKVRTILSACVQYNMVNVVAGIQWF